jgi:ABC-type proline/glycine betaine transport system substrate-binding protein
MVDLIKMVGKDFDLPDQQQEEKLRGVLISSFEYLINHNFAKLLQILYRADVDQNQLKQLLENDNQGNAAEVIADAYLRRQKQKVETWNKYSKKSTD